MQTRHRDSEKSPHPYSAPHKKMSAADDPVSCLRIIRGTGNHTETLTGVGDLAEVEVL